jgi:hypothetical protein
MFSLNRTTRMAGREDEVVNEVKTGGEARVMTAEMPRHQRFYALHREEKLAKYHNNPEVIAKKEERERKKAEKEAEKEAKRIEKEKKRQENLALALLTKQKIKSEKGGLDNILDKNCPA